MAKLKYDKEFPARAEDYARQGMRDEDIAKKLGISVRVYYDYQKKYPQFLQAIKRGKAPIDFEIENKLLDRARGFDYEETHVEYKPGKKQGDKPIIKSIKKLKKFVVPDPTSIIFFLKNRRPDLWKDRKDVDLNTDKPLLFEISEKFMPKKKVDDADK